MILASWLLLCSLFFAATFYQIRLPGLYYDEAADVVPAMQIVQGDHSALDMAQALKLGLLQIPVMVMVYVGAVSTYAVLPFSLLAVWRGGGKHAREVFGSNFAAPQADFAGRIQPYLESLDGLILFHAPRTTIFQGRFAAASQLAAGLQRRLVLEGTFHQRDGTDIIYVYRTEALAP